MRRYFTETLTEGFLDPADTFFDLHASHIGLIYRMGPLHHPNVSGRSSTERNKRRWHETTRRFITKAPCVSPSLQRTRQVRTLASSI